MIFLFFRRVIYVFFITTSTIICNELYVNDTKVYDLSNIEYKLYLENKITKEELYGKRYKNNILFTSRYLVKLLKEYKKVFTGNSDDKISLIEYFINIEKEFFNNIVLFNKELDVKSIKKLFYSISNQDISTYEAILEIDLLIKDIKDIKD